MLRINALEAGYGDSQVLFGMDFEVGGGEVVTLLGRNGMGKTTTIRTIMGIVRAKKGSILFDGAPIHELHRVVALRPRCGHRPRRAPGHIHLFDGTARLRWRRAFDDEARAWL